MTFYDGISWDTRVEFAVAMEDLGFGGIAVSGHVMTGSDSTTEYFITPVTIARETEDVYLYPKTVNNHFRSPVFFAKQVTTLDVVSDGRLKLSMGAGWKENEAQAYDYDRPNAPARLRMLEESIWLLKRLWTEETISSDGDYYTLDGAMCRPHPIRGPHPLIMVGGGGESFALRITTQYVGSWSFWGLPEVMQHKLNVPERHCEGRGRPFEEIKCSWLARCLLREDEAELDTLLDGHLPRFRPENVAEGEFLPVGTPEQVRERLATFVGMGFDEVIVELIGFPGMTSAELFAEEVAPVFR